MGKKISNEARMLGILPSQGADPIPVGKIPDGGTQVAKGANADNTTVEIHEVTSGTIFYLTHTHLGVHNAGGAAYVGIMTVTNASDVEQYRLHSVRVSDDTGSCDGATYIPPIEIAAGWKITIGSGGANVDVYGFIHGYEV